MKEWRKYFEFNSFNSWKGLLYADWYKAVLNGKFKPPVEVSFDMIHACNLHCKHCNAGRYVHDYNLCMNRKMPDNHVFNLINFLSDWGVEAFCFGGGGESTLHPMLGKAVELCTKREKPSALITNASCISNILAEQLIFNCRFIGCSVDAA